MEVIKAAIVAALEEDKPMTVRQVFYRLVSNGVIAKSEGEYKTTVIRLLGEMRRSGEVPFEWLADNTRWIRKPDTDSSLELALKRTREAYRRSVWDDQDVYVEVWLEKDALAGVLYDVTEQWDVPLMVTRGYASLSYLHAAAQTINRRKKPAFLYYLGDHDPSGCDITRAVDEGIREFAPKAQITFERIAVTPDQIRDMGLITRPTKTTDSRSKGFEGESVEVDAIPPKALKRIVERSITQHIDGDRLAQLRRVEEAERLTLTSISKHDWTSMNETHRERIDARDAEAESN